MTCHALRGIKWLDELLIIHIAYICDSATYRLFQGCARNTKQLDGAIDGATKSNWLQIVTN